MPRTKPRHASRLGWLPVLLLVLVGVGVVAASVYLLNGSRWPWQKSAEALAQSERDPSLRPYPRAARSIPAFTAITVEHLLESQTNQPLVVWLKPEQAREAGLLETSAILGRVVKGEKRAGYGFTEGDFLPKGSPASRTAAIPAGMHGVAITAGQIPTLRGLKANDRFVLVAAADPYSGPMGPKGSRVDPSVQQQSAEDKAFRAMTRRIVEGGLVIQRMPDSKNMNVKDEAFVAVPDSQYDELLSALNNGIEITAMAESTNPLVQVVPLPEPARAEPVERLTIQNGDVSETIVLPKGGGPNR